MGRKPKAESGIDPNAAESIRDLKSWADQLLDGDWPGAGAREAGEILTAAHLIERQAGELAKLRREIADERKAVDTHRRAADKAQAAIWKLEAAATTAGKTGKPSTPRMGAKPADAPAGAKPCREHVWDTNKTPPVCATCGKVKSNRGRKSHANPAANVAVATVDGVTKIDPPSLPLPAAAPVKAAGKIGIELADGTIVDPDDDFDEGTMRAGR